ncbi:minor capsid protein [Alkalibacterium sp. MB6]|uniref:minor capsid protein n=1 Tax=Alkalibacterium sp. MB6 TaxID=2081965 RepID=UPI00137B3C74|nr:minor capsid protein [Alkalibacterium sp. MB6]
MVKIEINLTAAYKKLSPAAVIKGQRAFANQAMADMNQFVPFREGPLRQATSIDMDGSGVNYHMKYARRHFYAPGNWNYTTPGTGPRWDLKAEGLFMNDWINAFRKGARW